MKIRNFLIIFFVIVGSSTGSGFSLGQSFARGSAAVIIIYLLITAFNWVNRLLKKINDNANN